MPKLSLTPVTTALVLLLLGANLSLAAVGFGGSFRGQEAGAGETVRPLTIRKQVLVAPAYGEDDEDCVIQTHISVDSTGREFTARKMVCADAD